MKYIKKHYCQLHYAQQHQNTPGMLQNKDGLIRTFMIPVRLLDIYRSEFEERAFMIDSVHIYKGPREGQKTTYPEQTLKALKIHARKSNHVSSGSDSDSTLLLESYSYYMDMIYQTMDNTTKVILEDQKED